MRRTRCSTRRIPLACSGWRTRRSRCGELTPAVRGRVMVHLHTQCGNGVYMPVWTDLLDPAVGDEGGPLWTSPVVWVFTADLPIAWPGEVLANRVLPSGGDRFENHVCGA